MTNDRNISVDRRRFLKRAAAGAVAAVPLATEAQQPQPPQAPPQQSQQPPAQQAQTTGAQVPGAAAKANETAAPARAEVLTTDRPGGDFMVDVLKALGIEYVCANPGSTFRGLHESIINYGGNKNPELITCCHEEASVAMGHGYFKVEGKPLAAMLHGPVGIQHASMAIYNAYCDRVPVYLIAGNVADATLRRPGVEWVHTAQDCASMIRDFTKWDDTPVSLAHFADSAVRAYKIAMTPPAMPVLIVADSDLQEVPIEPGSRLHVPKLPVMAAPQGDSALVAEAARLLVAAENPVIVADRCARTANGMKLLIELAETLQAPVIDQLARLNFPTRHSLNHSDNARGLIAGADAILGLELTDFWGTVNAFRDQLTRSSRPIAKPGTKMISITAGDLYAKGNMQDLQRYPELDLAIAGDAEATLPTLIEAVKSLLTAERKRAIQERGAKLAEARQKLLERAREAAAYSWDAAPISTARLSAELWAQIKNEDWALVSDAVFISNWPLRLWDFNKHYQFIGAAGGYGVGYGGPAAAGAALAHRKYGRLSVNIQNDGDLMYGNGILWTAAHHRIPLLSVVHNNRGYHQEVMHVQRMAARHQRGIENSGIGTKLDNPNIDYAKLAQSMGVYGEGPVQDPKDLGPAIRRALEVVRRGEPALVDVVTQPR
jgi:acetolactate synthase-1/2/3 large subunit